MRYIATIALALLPALTPAYALPHTVSAPALFSMDAGYAAQEEDSVVTDTWRYAPPDVDIVSHSPVAWGDLFALIKGGQAGDNFSFLTSDSSKELYYSASKRKSSINAANLIVIPEPGTIHLLIISFTLLIFRKHSWSIRDKRIPPVQPSQSAVKALSSSRLCFSCGVDGVFWAMAKQVF
ncbi:hypothetical protein [Hahella sp. HN01]|uniref:hypothetical protein n=1 Tax=Hahella sp. HN01 TaxID=2847262 RepID=UPI001C1F0430|nr:hypothetical protein [Hahella sp. HN01]MBU6952042.1 hypothetical protein [Hahella sp. HN01]